MLKVYWGSQLVTELEFWLGLLQFLYGYNEAQELSGWNAENAFFRVELDVVCSEVIKC